MTSSEEGSGGAYNNYIRPALRSATLIIPRTGERVKRVVTLRTPSEDGASSGDEERQTPRRPNGPIRTDSHRSHSSDEANVQTPLLARQRYRRSRRIPATPFNRKIARFQDKAWKRLVSWKNFWISKTGLGILKCSLAYVLGSLGTFMPLIYHWLGQGDGKHMMATVTVYFHPARSQGNMFEALFCAFVAFVYAAFISVTSMGVTVLFDDVLRKIIIGHMIVLIVFCGGGLGMVGWTKQRLSSPLVNVGCSLTSLAIITVLTREGSIQAGEFSMEKVVQVLKMVVLGCVASTIVCLLVMPVSARHDLKQSLIDITDSLGDTLTMTTRAFLAGSEEQLENEQHSKVMSKLSKQSAAMSKNLNESKWESYVFGQEVKHKLEARLVQCIQRLSQNVGGLRSAARSQFSLLAQQTNGYGGATPALSQQGSTLFGMATASPVDDNLMEGLNFTSLSAIAETDEEHAIRRNDNDEDLEDLPTVRSPREIFDKFIDQLGPSIRSLAYTLNQVLNELPYGPAPDFPITLSPQFLSSLNEAIELYSQARKDALASLYRSRVMHMSQPRALAADFEEVAASCGYFSYSLQDFAEELRTYLTIIDELQAYEENGQPRSWKWLQFWSRRRKKARPQPRTMDSDEPIYLVHSNDANHDDPVDPNVQTKPHHWKSTTPYQTKWRRRFWRWAHAARREDVKFAVKVGFGATLYALPSFVPATRPFYHQFRGEWGLLSYMLVCSMTIGSANTTGFARGWGTCAGALASVLAWTVSRGNVFLLAFFGWIMATITSYITVAKGNGPLGRFIMLTYNLSCLYAYSLSVKDDENDDDEGGFDPDILEISFHRVTAVLAGCAWGIIVTRLIWPISARKKFHDGLGVLLLRMALIWKRDPLDTFIAGAAPHPYMDLSEEFQLQAYLAQLQGLRRSASAEYELRGPFAEREFGRILASVGRMLEAFHSMNVIITKDSRASPGEAHILRHTAAERAYLATRISHLFQVLASSLRLQFPLNDALPSTDNARDRLLAKVFQFRRDHARNPSSSLSSSPVISPKASKQLAARPARYDGDGDVAGAAAAVVTDSDYALLYAYSLVTMQLGKEIKSVGDELGHLYGILDEERLKLQ